MRRLLLPAICAALAPYAHALVDTNANGLSDIWEKAFNGNALFSAANPDHIPTSDPDGDGWTNLQEATAGTNPFDANNAQGILTPSVSHTPAIREPAPPGAGIGQPAPPPPSGDPEDPFGGGTGAGTTSSNPLEIRRPARFTLTWPTVAGKAYRVDHSPDLALWTPSSGFFMGEGEPLTYTGEAIHADNTEPAKLFYRVIIEDADSDGDSLTDWEEGNLGTDPFSKDTDRDGISDSADSAPLVNSLHLDPDGSHGLPASLATGLIARWDLEGQGSVPPAQQGPYYTLARYIDSVGANHIVPFQSENKPDGMPSKGAGTNNTGLGFLCPPRTLLHNRTTYSVSQWVKIDQGTITAARPLAALFTHHRRLPQPVPYHDRYTIDINGMWIERLANGTQILKAGTSNYINYVPGTTQLTGGTWTFNGVTTTKPAGTFDDGKYHHFLLVRTSGSVTLYMDGALIGANANVPLAPINAPYETATGISIGRLYGEPAESGLNDTHPQATRGTFDRIRVWSRTVTAAEAESLYKQDIENDGLWDLTESRTRLWRDANSDAIEQASERAFVSSPYLWQPSTADTDGDKLTDIDEQTHGTEIHNADTDNDRLPDGWEVMQGLNPFVGTGADGPDGDPDNDGLINIREYAFGTKPKALPGDPAPGQPGSAQDSDGDGANDLAESINSHPGDASDGGQSIPPAARVSLDISVGDNSGSHSEDYSVVCNRIDPDTGEETHYYTVHSGGHGLFNEETVAFWKGQNYTYQLRWNGTNNDRRSANPGAGVTAEGPDFDYTFKIEPQGEDTGFLIDGYDPARSFADPANPLLAEDASDVAETASEFRENYGNRRVVLMGVSTVSADRMFGSSVQVLPGLEDIQLEITNTVTNEDFGTQSQLLEKAYIGYEEILGPGDNFGKDVADPRVWCIQTFSGPYGGIQAYLCGDPALPHGTVRIKGALKGYSIGTVKHDLTPDTDMASFLLRGETLAKGTGLGFPVEQGQGANATAAPGKAHHWAAALAAPVLMAGKVIEGQVVIFAGIYDGVIAGFTDDWKMIIAVRDGISTGGDWALNTAKAQLAALRTDPAHRLYLLKDGLTRFFQNQVCDKLGAAAAELGTVQGFLDTVWGLTPPGMIAKAPERFEALVGADPWELLSEAVAGWFDDFGTRMLAGAEKASWVAEPFPDNALITGTLQWVREVRYTTGYVFGYLAEQATVGVIGGKAITLTASMTMRGVKLVTANGIEIAARTGAVIAAKGKILKKAVAPVAMSVALRVSLEEGFTLAARTATPGVTGGKNILSVIEESYRALPGPAPAATISKLVDDIVASPRLAALNLQPGGALEILTATAQVNHRVSASVVRDGVVNWPKLADRLVKEQANDLLRYADFEQGLKLDTPQGRVVAKGLLESLDGKTAQQVMDGDIFMPPSIKNLYPQMYHYADFNTLDGFADDFTEIVGGVVGRWRLHKNDLGRYVTPERIETQALAKSRLQAPLNGALQEVPTKGRFRFEGTTSDVAGEYLIPKAKVHSGADNAGEKLWLEIKVKDNPARGTGGAPQFVEEAVREGTLFDTVTQQFVRDKVHLQEILNTNP